MDYYKINEKIYSTTVSGAREKSSSVFSRFLKQKKKMIFCIITRALSIIFKRRLPTFFFLKLVHVYRRDMLKNVWKNTIQYLGFITDGGASSERVLPALRLTTSQHNMY